MLRVDERAPPAEQRRGFLTEWEEFELEVRDACEFVAPYVAEFAGTFMLVFAVGCNSITGSPVWMPTCIAFSVMVGMYAFADVSGGHLNPALSLAMALVRKLEMRKLWGYLAAQAAGGLLAALFATNILGRHVRVGPKDGYSSLDALIVEVVYSTTFCFVALNCMASTRNNPRHDRNQFFSIAVGFVAIAGGHTTGDVCGAFFNPAATLGFGLAGPRDRVWCFLYAGYQLAGAALAVLLFFMVRPEELVMLRHSLGIEGALGALCGCGGRAKDAGDSERAAEVETMEVEHYGDSYAPAFATRLLSEFLGTYVVVFTFGLSTVAAAWKHDDAAHASTTALPSADKTHETNTIAWASGAAMLSMAYSLANVSGAHFNPATTLAVMLSGRGVCSLPEGLTIIVAQGGAAIAAAATYLWVRRGADIVSPTRVVDLGPKSGYNWRSVAIGEVVFTMAVALVVLCMTTVRSQRYSKACKPRSFQSALAVGMCVTAGSYALEGISGGHLNPAVSLGVSAANFVSSGFEVGTRVPALAIYACFQCMGGALGAVAFALLHPLEYKSDPLLRH